MFTPKQHPLQALAPAAFLFLSICCSSAALGQTQAAPDNSGTNKTQNHPVTADQQKNNASDRQLTAKIRRSIVADKSLSTYGHNVKIIVAGGSATLKGPVHSEEEKQNIEKKVTDIVGTGKVTNEITVKQ